MSKLFTNITAENDEVVWTAESFSRIFSKVRYCQKLAVGHITTIEPSFSLDNIFVTSFAANKPKYLAHLDISGLPVSTLSFLLYTPGLECLIISECKCLIGSDLKVLRTLKKLNQLECAFLKIDSPPLITILRSLSKLTYLDVIGLPFTPDKIHYTLTKTAAI